jgi:hypothetical protein
LATWDDAFNIYPAAATDPALWDDAIRSTRLEFDDRFNQEHINHDVTGTSQSVHRPGAPRAYLQATDPTLRPDGTTPFSTLDDIGRLLVNSSTENISYYKTDPSADFYDIKVSHADSAAAYDLTQASMTNDSGSGSDLYWKIVEIGSWTPSLTTPSISVPHGLTLSKIRYIEIMTHTSSAHVAEEFPSCFSWAYNYHNHGAGTYVNVTTDSVTGNSENNTSYVSYYINSSYCINATDVVLTAFIFDNYTKNIWALNYPDLGADRGYMLIGYTA